MPSISHFLILTSVVIILSGCQIMDNGRTPINTTIPEHPPLILPYADNGTERG